MTNQPLRLLFVEDVPADKELAERALRKEGMVFDSMCVDTAEAFITALDEFKPDIVISDYSMPEFDGMSALKISLERDILLPFIVLTGAQNEEIAVACMKSGATDYVLKERLARLPFAVKEALEQKQVWAAKEAAEKALRESEENYRNIFNGVQDAIFVETLDGRRILAVNDRASEIYGYSRAELLTKSVSDLVPEGQPVLTSASKEVSSAPMQTVNLRSNGERFPIEITGRMEKINGEKLLLVIVRDVTERKRTEEELLKLRKAVDSSREVIFMTDPNGLITFINPEFSRLYGYTAAEVVGKATPRILKSGNMKPSDYENFWKTILNRQVAQSELINKTKDGRLLTIEGSVTPVLDERGDISAFLAIQRDVTERKRAEEALRESEAMLTKAQGIGHMGNWKWNVATNETVWSDEVYRLYGLNPEKDKPDYGVVIDTLTPEFKDDFLKAIEDALNDRKPFEGEYNIIRPDGTRRYTYTKGEVSRDKEGNPTGMFGIVQDITERKQAEEKLRQSEEQNRRLIDVMPSGVVVHSEGRIVLANQVAVKAFGAKDSEQLIGTMLIDRVHPNYRNVVVARVQSAIGKGTQANLIEEKLLRLDGSAFDAEVTAIPITYEGKTSVLALFNDISERKQAAQALERRARELQTLYEVSLEVNAQTSLEKLLSSIVKQATSLLGTNGGGLYLMEPDGQSLKLVVVHNLPQEYINITLKLGEGLSGQVAQSGKPIIVEDYQNWSGRAGVFNGTPFRRVLGIPLTAKNRVIGVINISDFTNTGPFAEDEVRLVSLFADQAALAIESARLHEQEHTRNRELATLYESAMAISSDLSLEVVLKTVVEQVSRAINTAGCTLSFLDRERDTLVTMVDHRTDSADTADTPGTTYSLKDFPATRHVLETRQPLFESRRDPQIDPAELALMEKLGMDTELLLPLVARDQVIGLMELYEVENKERVFTEDEIRLAQSLSVQTAIFIDNARLFEHAERRLQQTEALHTIDMAIASSMDVNFIFSVIFGQMISQLGVDAAVVLLYNPITQVLEYAAGRGFRTDALRYTRLRLGDGYAGRAALERQMIHIPDLHGRKTDFLRSPTFSQEGFVSYFGMPLIAKGELKGVLEVFHRSAFDAGTEWLNFLETLAGQVAIAIDNAQLFENLQRSNFELTLSYDATIEGWSRAMELRDEETEGHTQRVTTLTLELARQMGVPETELIHIRRGALLHDIGKIGIPDSILLKSDMLTDEEQTIMRRHPTYAYEMLTPIPYLRPALDIPYSHHEKWDGTGYPQGLKGGQIPLPARIFAIVDVWDALTSNRPYRPAWTKEKAIEYIREQSGKHFDPKVTMAFLQKVVDNDI